MHIAIVAPGPVTSDSGGQTYLVNLAKSAEEVQNVRLTYFVSKGHEHVLPTGTRVVILPSWSATTIGRLIAEHLWIPFWLTRNRVDALYYPNNFASLMVSVPYVVAIRSMLVFNKPGAVGIVRQWYRMFLAKRSARRAHQVITPSEHTKKEIVRHLNISASRIRVIPHGLDASVFTVMAGGGNPTDVLKKHGITEPYILYVSSLWPYKNHDKLIHAFEYLVTVKHIPHHLVLVGRGMNAEMSYQREIQLLIRNYHLESCTHMIDFLPHDTLSQLYRHADAFVFPSETESYGNPIFEAMACGIPVVCSSKHDFREFVGPAAQYANPDDRLELSSTIHRVLVDKDLRRTMIVRGFHRVRPLSWDVCARETLQTVMQAARQNE